MIISVIFLSCIWLQTTLYHELAVMAKYLKIQYRHLFCVPSKFILWVFQLQLQRNEVISLINLLNRLSESVKFVHDMGPSIENATEGQVSEPPLSKLKEWQRIWESVIGIR